MAQSYASDFIGEKNSTGKESFAVIDESGVASYATIRQGSLVFLSAQDFFSANERMDWSISSVSRGTIKTEETKDFSDLKSLLSSEDWPEAVFQAQIADENSEKDKAERAEGICDIILPPLEGKRLLDFGCGEGHIVNYSAKDSELSVGYDIEKSLKSQFTWEEKNKNTLLTTDFEKVKAEGPYDLIMIYDVLDHAKQDTMSEILTKASSVLSEDGRIYLRCHPWCGRHGGHAYREMNKAFVHLIFNEEELKSLGLDLNPTHKVLFPIATYDKAIQDSNLVKESEHDIETEEVESFFSEVPIVRDRILKMFDISQWGEKGRPSFQMSQCFVDYVLKK